MRPDGDLTGALQRWDDGDAGALDDLLQAAHAHVRAALAAVLRRGSAPQSLQPSAIVQAAAMTLEPQVAAPLQKADVPPVLRTILEEDPRLTTILAEERPDPFDPEAFNREMHASKITP